RLDAQKQLEGDAAQIGLKISTLSEPDLPLKLYKFWGYMPSIGDIAQLVGATHSDTLVLQLGGYQRENPNRPNSFSIRVRGRYEAAYTIYRMPNGYQIMSPVVRNDTGARTAASGRDVLRAMRHMQQMGITKLT